MTDERRSRFGTLQRMVAGPFTENRRSLRAAGFRGGRPPRVVVDVKIAVCGHWARNHRGRPGEPVVCPTCGVARDVVQVRERRVA